MATGPNSLASRVHYTSGPVYRGAGFQTYQEIYILKVTVLCNTMHFFGTCTVPWFGQLLTLHLGGLGLILGYFLWSMWWIKWPQGRVFSKYFRFPLSVS